MGVSVFFRRAAMGGPAGVADAVGPFEGRLGDGFFEVAKLSRGSADLQFARTVHDRDARGVVTAILEFAKALDDHGHDFLDRKSTRLNSSHGYISYAVFCLQKKKQPL